jgi:SAM-dependent methyltransferase
MLVPSTSSGNRFFRWDDNMVDNRDEGPITSALDERRRWALERSRLFDREAERYDRCRPAYPDALIDDLLGPMPEGLHVLDVGCGTGIASRLMARRGAKILGVDVAPRMAEIARGHGIDVEVGSFEDWESAGRTYDRIVSAQAWHWLDRAVATTKAASVLRPGGRLCLIWNAGSHPDELADALAEVYASVLPSRVHTVFRGYAANRSTDRRSGSEAAAIAPVPDFDVPTEKWFSWAQTYHRDQWLEQLLSRSDHTSLDPAVQEQLFEGIGAAIDDFGGSFVMNFETVLVTAIRQG